jgi:lysozyme
MTIEGSIRVASGLIRTFEGLRLKSYKDPVGVWTVGYGATGPRIVEGVTWTTLEAERDLDIRVRQTYNEVMSAVAAYHLNDYKVGALISFVYNFGLPKFLSSTLLKKIREQDDIGVALEFVKWRNPGDARVEKGLLKRRLQEASIYLT